MKVVKTRFVYGDSTDRIYAFDCEDSLVSAVSGKIEGINSSLSAGTAGGLSSFFVSDSGASFLKISSATVESSSVVPVSIRPAV